MQASSAEEGRSTCVSASETSPLSKHVQFLQRTPEARSSEERDSGGETAATVAPPLSTGSSFERREGTGDLQAEEAQEEQAKEDEEQLLKMLAIRRSSGCPAQHAQHPASAGADHASESSNTAPTTGCGPNTHDELQTGADLARACLVSTSIEGWDVDKVCAWLRSLNPAFAPYAERFRANDVDGAVLQRLGRQELEELGVHSLGHRVAITAAIVQAMRLPGLRTGLRRRPPMAPPPGLPPGSALCAQPHRNREREKSETELSI